MPAHTHLWRTQEGIATLTTYSAAPTQSQSASNPLSEEPVIDQIFMYGAFAMIGVAVIIVLIASVRALVRICRRKSTPAEPEVEERQYSSVVHVVIASKPSTRDSGTDASPRSDTDSLDEIFKPYCTEREFNDDVFWAKRKEDEALDTLPHLPDSRLATSHP
ncbi:hypothetical protein EXIGLDRAFT_833576 [Exidia glandulosa HHB12029]|uniref:Uncharacterized protein n=1 Tax=Exidia glandulosa HHB12029 TaxID=1314781 RepID=A0A166AZC6_EXIGL|nr:hypothetical protein EXIGLDRAFT_833576 [Exidia glandulosa HHB12029]